MKEVGGQAPAQGTRPETLIPDRIFEVAVAIPCWNEAPTIGAVVAEFRDALPSGSVHVFDNNSTDGSADIARRAGATLHRVRRQGKGNVFRTILDEVTADAVVIVDGDGTYPPEAVHALLAPVINGEADMVVGARVDGASPEALRPLNRIGNRAIVAMVNAMFGTRYTDILSGYRVLGRRFIESVPVLTTGFEIETELTVRALEEGMLVQELPIDYRPRPNGSESKLRPFHDGYRIVLTAVVLLRDHYPLRVFGGIGALFLLVGITALVLRLLAEAGVVAMDAQLLADLATLFTPLGLLAIGIGLTLNTVTTRSREWAQIARRTRRRG